MKYRPPEEPIDDGSQEDRTKAFQVLAAIGIIAVIGFASRGCAVEHRQPTVYRHQSLELTVPAGVTANDWTGFEHIRATRRGDSPLVWRFRATHDDLPKAQVYIQQIPGSGDGKQVTTASAEGFYASYYPLDRLKPGSGKPLTQRVWKPFGNVQAFGEVKSLPDQQLIGTYTVPIGDQMYMLYYRLPPPANEKQAKAKRDLITLVESIHRR